MRMSISSSTIRMSCAMAGRAQLPRLLGGVQTVRCTRFDERENQLYPRAAGFPIFQHEFSLVIFHYLLDDGETQTGSLRARRDIGLGQSLAAVLGQALPVVLDDHRGRAPHVAYRQTNMSCGVCTLVGDTNLDRLDPVLDDVDQGLPDEARVAPNNYGMGRENRLKGNIGMGGTLQEYGLTHDFDQVFRFDHRRGHARDRGELVDHAPDS